MKSNLFGALLCVLFMPALIHAQDKLNIKFGKIGLEDFNLSAKKFDTSASAVVIADVGTSTFEGNNKAGLSIIFNHYKRIKILNKNGFDAATVEILLYSSGSNEERLQNLKAFTYNIENGKVVQTKLDDKSIFTNKTSKNIITKKFTFPAIKEGSIVEFSYTQASDFIFNLQPWAFQGEYPILWSEYTVTIPEYYRYVFLSQGYQPFLIKTANEVQFHSRVNFGNSSDRMESQQLDGIATENRWVMKDVPALKEEKFTTTITNHISKIEFQLSQVQYPNSAMQSYMSNWVKVSEELTKNESFGADLDRGNGWMDEYLQTITKGATTKLGMARMIYAYLRDNFTCTEHNRMYTTNPIKTVFKNKNGNEAEINLLLIAMLKHEKIESDPVILSTRSHGFANMIYPLLDRFNYVICAARLDSSEYFLDASQSKLGFGNLADYCYNGGARIINMEQPRPIYFDADSLQEAKTTMIYIGNDEKNHGMLYGSYQSILGNIESYNQRDKFLKNGEKDYFKQIKSAYPEEIEINNIEIDSLKQLEYPVTIRYDLSFKHKAEDDVIYFSPFIADMYKENPFKAAERQYPVEIPYRISETYILNMEIPEGYVVDELPKSAKVTFNDKDGLFEYLIAKDDERIQLRSRIQINRANFAPEDYNSIRDFFGFIVKKQTEQIVFKKKK